MSPPGEEMLIGAEHHGKRLDVCLFEGGLFASRAQAQKAIADGQVLLNGETTKAGYRLRRGDRLVIRREPPAPMTLAREEVPLDVVYEDQDLLVINKPKGLVVHPAPGHPRGTLVNALLHHCRDLAGIGGALRPGIVHRLDKDTSGLLVVAKNDAAHLGLAAQIKKHEVDRIYMALVHGRPPETGRIEAPIGRHERQRKKMAVRPGRGKEAVTHFTVLQHLKGYALVQARLETGRTHQVRVHLASIGCPVVGDPLYGKKDPLLPVSGQLLHAHRLSFHHPRTGKPMDFNVPPPAEFQKILQGLQKRAGSSAVAGRS